MVGDRIAMRAAGLDALNFGGAIVNVNQSSLTPRLLSRDDIAGYIRFRSTREISPALNFLVPAVLVQAHSSFTGGSLIPISNRIFRRHFAKSPASSPSRA